MPAMRTFSPLLRRLPRDAAGLGPANQAGGVKIIDTFAVEQGSPYGPDGPKPFNVLSNLALTGV